MPRTKKPDLQFDTHLGTGLRAARVAAGIGFREAARLAELDQTSIWRIENGQITPTLATIEVLARLYGANVNIGPDGLMITWLGSALEDNPQT